MPFSNQEVVRHIKLEVNEASKLNIDWLTGKVAIMPSPHNYIEIIQLAEHGFSQEKGFQYQVTTPNLRGCTILEDRTVGCATAKENDMNYTSASVPVITITDGRKSSKLGINMKKTSLEIYVPRAMISNMNIKCVGTDIELSDMNISTLHCTVVSGKLRLNGVHDELQLHTTGSEVTARLSQVSKMEVKSTSSKLDLTGEFQQIHSRLTGSKLNLTILNHIKELHSSSTASKVRVHVPVNLRFSLSTGKLTSRKAIRSSFPLHYEVDQLKQEESGARFHVSIAGGHMEIKTDFRQFSN